MLHHADRHSGQAGKGTTTIVILDEPARARSRIHLGFEPLMNGSRITCAARVRDDVLVVLAQGYQGLS
jgi:hypothetical protein